MMRLNKYLVEAGLCSRREADRWIAAGRVWIDSKVASLGSKVLEGEKVYLDGNPVEATQEKVVLKVFKPRGIVCTEDKRERKNIIDFLNYPVRLTYAGRLDKESEGLLLMTNDGDLIQKIMKSRNFHEKEYHVEVNRPIHQGFIRKMEGGVLLVDEEKGLCQKTRPCRIEKLGERTFSIVLTQGLNRQIRRMCEVLGYQVEKLVRIRIMNVGLGDMVSGESRLLTKEEKETLYEQASNR